MCCLNRAIVKMKNKLKKIKNEQIFYHNSTGFQEAFKHNSCHEQTKGTTRNRISGHATLGHSSETIINCKS